MTDEPTNSTSHWGLYPTPDVPQPADFAEKLAPEKAAIDRQIGGAHYKTKGIQPIEYIMANDLTYCEGSAVKYITRWHDKGGVQDLRKAIHFLEMQIEDFEKTGERR